MGVTSGVLEHSTAIRSKSFSSKSSREPVLSAFSAIEAIDPLDASVPREGTFSICSFCQYDPPGKKKVKSVLSLGLSVGQEIKCILRSTDSFFGGDYFSSGSNDTFSPRRRLSMIGQKNHTITSFTTIALALCNCRPYFFSVLSSPIKQVLLIASYIA